MPEWPPSAGRVRVQITAEVRQIADITEFTACETDGHRALPR
ncbi:hypothetical protein [Streptomyces sp. NPDC056982]